MHWQHQQPLPLSSACDPLTPRPQVSTGGGGPSQLSPLLQGGTCIHVHVHLYMHVAVAHEPRPAPSSWPLISYPLSLQPPLPTSLAVSKGEPRPASSPCLNLMASADVFVPGAGWNMPSTWKAGGEGEHMCARWGELRSRGCTSRL